MLNERERARLEELRTKYRGVGQQVQPKSNPSSTQTVSKPSFLEDAGADINQGINTAVNSFKRAGEDIVDIAKGNDSLAEKATRIGGRAFGGAGEGIFNAGLGAVKAVLPQKAEDFSTNMIQQGAEAVMDTGIAKSLVQRYQDAPEDVRNQIDAALGFSEGILKTTGSGAVAGTLAEQSLRGLKRLDSSVDDILRGAKVPSLFQGRTPQSLDEIAEIIDTTVPAGTRIVAEGTSPNLTVKERLIGLRPDLKKRVQNAGPEKVREYFDVAHARNNADTITDPVTGREVPVPTPYEYGALQAQKAVDQMEALINDTGGKIGKTRKKLGTYQANPDAVEAIESSFKNQLSKLNLEVRNGAVRQKPGTVRRTSSNGDVNALNRLYQDLLTTKQAPTLTNLIDLRTTFDDTINFGKRSSEVSNSVDPLSRSVRKEIADQAANIVGKSEATELQRYSEFMDALNDLRSYTDRRAGGEYLLRVMLSGRGGEARKIVQTIKEYTGIDLMDDATLMTLATDTIGNQAQKNLFRQEITNAGFDFARLLKGDPSGILGVILEKGIDATLDAEDVIMEAAKKGR